MLALLGVRASGSAWGSEGEAAFGLQQGAVRTLEEYLYGGGAAAARPEDAEWQLPLDLATFAKSLREKPVEASDLHDFESAKAEVVRLRTLLAAAAGGSTGGDEITVATCRRSAEVPDDFDKTVMPALAKLIAGDRPVAVCLAADTAGLPRIRASAHPRIRASAHPRACSCAHVRPPAASRRLLAGVSLAGCVSGQSPSSRPQPNASTAPPRRWTPSPYRRTDCGAIR